MRSVKVQNTHNLEILGSALLDILSVLNSPQRDVVLLREAGVEIDRALFPLLVAIGARGPLTVGDLADLVGRDHTTVSRQLAKLKQMKLVASQAEQDRRRNAVKLTAEGEKIVQKISRARRRLLSKVLSDWSEADRTALAALTRRFADAVISR
ncbi:MAG TPA: MarR family transcriptional regulator [Rhizomicrobium sp.]|nr:MarR family transcriptional regulator [Rhizomicrobium sp.]